MADFSNDPLWYKDAIVYELHARTFSDASADGMGDFVGLTRKLDYLQELGISCIWLQPFFPSPMRDDGYDIADFRGVNPAYGSIDDFRRFLEEAHRRGIRVLAELVLGHTSDEHPWFQAARRAPAGSPLRSFYVWQEADTRNQESGVRGQKSGVGRQEAGVGSQESETSRLTPNSYLLAPGSWTWDAVAKACYRHHFFEHEPDLNWRHAPVRHEMRAIIRFWLDMGLDGLGLSALASLRANVDCDIDDFLKEIRRDIDAHYPGRVLLAGLNCPPVEALPYFGAGAECHLALHGTLMPALFMALSQEDRHPVTAIMKQTPALPAGCQWVLMLRNHDELALGLLSEEDRDELVRDYAVDPRMRRAPGIVRRLAPLLENSRARIQLMFGLLFSLPGTPVIYYGDELGMGDNIYLGDRQALRTPMQWSGAANAGFSEADAAQVVTPPNSDPVYGYQAVNVETQRRDPSSLLHWMQRLIAARRNLPMLGHGEVEFLTLANRKVLAYLRRSGEDVFLAVANLARTIQPAELDLSAFAERIPVEVFGQTGFPRIGTDPYFFTLGPHEFYWFQLHRKFEPIAVQRLSAVTEEIKEIPCLTVSGTWRDILEGEDWHELVKLIPAYLKSQRWFGAKARAIQSIRVADWGALPLEEAHMEAELSFAQCPVVFVLLEIRFDENAGALYALPLEVIAESDAIRRLSSLRGRVLARLLGSQGELLLIDAIADNAFCENLLGAIGRGREFAFRFGRLRAAPTSAYDALRGEPATPLKVTQAAPTSSNSLVIFGRRLLLKLFRHPDVGVNPDLEIGRFLAERSAFGGVPRMAGSLEYFSAGVSDGQVRTLAILQQLVAHQGDGWQHAIDELGHFFERASARQDGTAMRHDARSWLDLADSDPPPNVVEAIGHYLQAAQTLGRRTAELHLALASAGSDRDFAPQPLARDDLEALAVEAGAEAESVLAALHEQLDRLSENLRPAARRVLAEGPRLLALVRSLPSAKIEAAKIRCHGDYHLGQVLRVDGDFAIIDFEGEPAHPLAQRRAKQSPLKDVAGMMRSFSYAAYAGLFAFTQHRPTAFEPLAPWADLWQTWTAAAFLRAYRDAADGASFVPGDRAAFTTLLRFFLLGKALYELGYELNNRPDWLGIPMQGITVLLDAQ